MALDRPNPATALTVSIADATADEGYALSFTVTLSRASDDIVKVDFETTTQGTATEGRDFPATEHKLIFEEGVTSLKAHVSVWRDGVDDSGETVIVQISNAVATEWDRVRRRERRTRLTITDAKATGTITNTGPMPRGLLARFGRAAAVHVVEQVEERLQAPREPGFEGRFAGQELRPGMEREMALGLLSRLGGGVAGTDAPGDRFGGAPAGPASFRTPLPGGAPRAFAVGLAGMAGSMGRTGVSPA